MKWVLYDFKTAREPWFDEAEKLYLKKIAAYAEFEVLHLKSMKADREDAEIKKKFEAKVLLGKLTTDDYVILLDEKGKKSDSLEFASLVENVSGSGKKRAVFIVGGAYGVTDEIRSWSHKTLCLSDLTMNHLVAEVMLLEQFYRAQTIINRIPYHNQ